LEALISSTRPRRWRAIYSICPATSNGVAHGIAAADGYVYYMIGDTGLRIIDISNKTAPALISTLDTGASYTADIITEGYYAYITNSGNNGFKIIDIGIEIDPSVAGVYYGDYWIHDVVLIEGIPFIHVHGGIRAVDVSEPFRPQTLLSYNDSTSPTCGYMFYTGTYLLDNGGNAAADE
jgi:hypothetical protein